MADQSSHRTAFLWFLLGFVVVPGLLYFPNNALLTGYYVGSGHFYAYATIAFLVFLLARRTVQHFRKFMDSKPVWENEKGLLLPILSLIIFLEAIALIIQQLDNHSRAIFSRYFSSEISDISIISWLPSTTQQELFEVFVIILTIPVCLRLLRAYFELIATWIAAASYVLGENFERVVSRNPTAAREVEKESQQSVNLPKRSFFASSREAILRAEVRTYVSALCIVVTSIFAIAMFQAVFESSATRRANLLIEEIERSPIAFSTKYEDITLDLIATVRTFRQSRTNRPAPDSPDAVAYELNSNVLVQSRTYGDIALGDFLKKVFEELNVATTDANEIQAEADLFLSRLSELRRELEGVSRTNWDVIVVRTAIILLALVVVGIFQRILMNSLQERRSWEVKSAAMVALDREHLTRGEVDAFLEIVKSEPFFEAKSKLRGGASTDVDALVARLESLVNPKPPGT